MIYLDCEQGSDEWIASRRGIPTASAAAKIVTPKTGKLSASADTYIDEIIGEMIEPGEGFQGNQWTERGHALEPEARAWYEFQSGLAVRQVGMILLDDRSAGVSPDGLVGSPGMIEIKCPKASTHVGWVRKGVLPDKHKPQCHMALHISEREWLDFLSYYPGQKNLLVRITPDQYTKNVGDALSAFIEKLDAAKAAVFQEAA